MSDSQQIYPAMAAIMAEIGAIGKDSRNTQQNFNFRGIDTVYNELHDVLAKHQVFTVPEVLNERSEERQTKSGGNLIYRILTMKYTFYHADGSNVSTIVIGEGMDSGDKAANKSMSIAHKYALLQTFCIPTEEEKDPDAESHDVKPKAEPKKETKQPASKLKEDGPPQTDNFIPSDVKVLKEGVTKSNKPYKIFSIVGPYGEYKTFSETFADVAEKAKTEGSLIGVTYKQGKFGNEIVEVTGPKYDDEFIPEYEVN